MSRRTHASGVRASGQVPEDARWLFWDVDPATLLVERDRTYILPRVLEFGGLAEVRWAVTSYGLDGIRAFLRDEGHPELTPRTLAFWRAVLHAGEEPWRDRRGSRPLSAAPWIV